VVVDHLGKRFEGDLGILAVGALRSGLVGSHLKAPRCAGVLKMLSIARIDGELPTAIADADSMRHYPAYRSPGWRAFRRVPLAARHQIQPVLVQRADGTLTSATPTERRAIRLPLAEEVADALLERIRRILAVPLAPVVCRCTDDRLCCRAEALPGVWVVTGPGAGG
jgi:hypothetical protein